MSGLEVSKEVIKWTSRGRLWLWGDGKDTFQVISIRREKVWWRFWEPSCSAKWIKLAPPKDGVAHTEDELWPNAHRDVMSSAR